MVDTKICSKCKLEKPLTEFYFRRDQNKYRSDCKSCFKIGIKHIYNPINKKSYNTKYYNENRDSILLQSKKYRETHTEQRKVYIKLNKDRINKSNSLWLKNHPDKLKEKQKRHRQKHDKEWHKRIYLKTKNNPIRRLAKQLRDRFKKALKNNYKAGSAVGNLGCSIKEFKIKLESRFCTNPITGLLMTWDNYGSEWHIDHIVPLSCFDLSNYNDVCIACHYLNLQPMWKEENLKKSDTVPEDAEQIIKNITDTIKIVEKV